MESLAYLDLLVLQKIDENSVIERFGPSINSSFFETANLLGTLKSKGYVDLEASIGGMSRVSLTEAGRQVMEDCKARSLEELDALDESILKAVAGGVTDSDRLAKSLSVRESDLAVHLNKLVVQGFLESYVKSAKAAVLLTEKGFNKIGVARGVESAMAPGQKKLTDHEAAPHAIEHSSGQTGAKPAPNAAMAPASQPAHKEDIAQDAKDILFGMFQPKKPKQEREQKPESTSAQIATKPTASYLHFDKPEESAQASNEKTPQAQEGAKSNPRAGEVSLADAYAQAQSEVKPVGIPAQPMPSSSWQSSQPVKTTMPLRPVQTPSQPISGLPKDAAGKGFAQPVAGTANLKLSDSDIQTVRLQSKIEHYLMLLGRYALWIILVAAVLAVAYFFLSSNGSLPKLTA